MHGTSTTTDPAEQPEDLPHEPSLVEEAVAGLADAMAPGIGPNPTATIRLRDTLRHGGWTIIGLAVPLVMMEQLVRDATTTLAPDIQRTFGLGDAMLIAVLGFSGVALTLGGPLAAWLADRIRRRFLVVVSALLGTVALLGAALAQETWQIFVALTLTGVAAAYSNPVFGSLISEAYPAEGRGRVYSLHAMATPLGQLIGPTLAGSLAALSGAGADAWRWAYVGLAVPYALLAVAAAVFLREPPRGGRAYAAATNGATAWEQPIGIVAAFRRLVRIRTFLFVCMGVGSLGLALYAVPIQMSLLLESAYGLEALPRGLIFSLTQIPVIAAMIIGGHQFDRLYRDRPERTMYLALGGIAGFGVVMCAGIWAQPLPLLLAVYVVAMVFNGITLVSVSALIASVTPPRYLAQAFAVMTLFTFLMGGFFGAVFSGVISGWFGTRAALAIAVGFSAAVAAFFYHRGSRHIRADSLTVDGEVAAEITKGAQP